jgi:cytoskeletal protein RodZ
MTDDFDDDALRDAIGSRTGGSVDLGSARTAVIGRARRVRTIRTVAIGGTAVLLLVAGLLVIPNGQDRTGTPADQPDAPAPTRSTVPTTTDAPVGTSTTTISPPSTSSTGAPITAATPSSAPLGVPASTSPQPITDPAAVTPPSTTSPTTAPTAPTTSSAPVVADPPFTRRYDSPGGSITVDWSGSALSLVSVDANAGYTSEIEDQSVSRIRVRFRGDADVRIEVRVRDGRVESTVS